MSNTPGDVTRVPREMKRDALLAEIENRLNEAEEMVKKLKKSTSVALDSGAELVRRLIAEPEEKTATASGGEETTPDGEGLIERVVLSRVADETERENGLTGTVVLTSPSEVAELQGSLSRQPVPPAPANAIVEPIAPQCVETREDARLLTGMEISGPLLNALKGGSGEQCREVERDHFGRPILRAGDGSVIAREGPNEEDARERRRSRKRMGLS